MTDRFALECNHLNFVYPDGNRALTEINLKIGHGEKVALIGPNGAGKSTLLLQFNGILRGIGTLNVAGVALTEETLMAIRRKVGVVFQDPNDQLFCPTVYDDVAFGPLHFGLTSDELKNLVAISLKDVGLTGFETKSSHHISLGERKRAAIATVLACRPEIILLDEPTANLDPKHRNDLIKMVQNWDYTTIIATHDLDLAWETCGRCIILNQGTVKSDGPVKEILQNERLLKENELDLPLRLQSVISKKPFFGQPR